MSSRIMLSSSSSSSAMASSFLRCFSSRISTIYPPPSFTNNHRLLTIKTRSSPSVSKLGAIRFTARASSSSSSPIDSSMINSMKDKIKQELKADVVTVVDAYGDGRHVSIDVVSAEFEGKSAVNRQRMVYKAIWEELQTTVHAVDQMTTRTPDEAATN